MVNNNRGGVVFFNEGFKKRAVHVENSPVIIFKP
jgi:hypothetical protein